MFLGIKDDKKKLSFSNPNLTLTPFLVLGIYLEFVNTGWSSLFTHEADFFFGPHVLTQLERILSKPINIINFRFFFYERGFLVFFFPFMASVWSW